MKWICCLSLAVFISCTAGKKMHWGKRLSNTTGTEFYHQAFSMQWKERDSFALKEILAGNVPPFLKKFVAIHVTLDDSSVRKKIKAVYFVAPDYLSIGGKHDWARINITPHAAQKIADSFQCFLPTEKMVDDIYRAAKVKLEPVPLFAFRDSTPTMWHHHLIIEGQRKERGGLIAGIQKDVVISGKLSSHTTPGAVATDRVAIYGWHKPGGIPIQPLYTGHVYWWVDYSQGIRLVYHRIKINGKWMNYEDVLKDPVFRKVLCNEENCNFIRYPY